MAKSASKVSGKIPAVKNTGLSDLPNERWKPIPGFEAYEISDYGRVKSTARIVINSLGYEIQRRAKILKLRVMRIDKSAESFMVLVNLSKYSKNYCFAVNRLVYNSFVETIDLKDRSIEVKRKDGDHLNCHYQNLHLEVPEKSSRQYVHKLKSSRGRVKIAAVLNTMPEDLEGEEWKHVPGFDEKYLLSNYGRLKSTAGYVPYINGRIVYRKERIHRVAVSPVAGKKELFTLCVTLMKDGVAFRLSLPRYVYYLFVKQFDIDDHKLAISRKDGDYLNCHFENLELKSVSDIKVDTFETKRSQGIAVKKEIPVHQYDIDGKYLRTHKSIEEASVSTGIVYKKIFNAIYTKQLQGNSYYWIRGTKQKRFDISAAREKQENYLRSRRRQVEQLSQDGKVMKVFESMGAAISAVGLKSANAIRQACVMGYSAAGFRWRYVDEEGNATINNENKPVSQYTLKGKFVRVYESAGSAARKLGIVPSAISNAARLKHRTAKGHYWRYGTNEPVIDISEYEGHRQYAAQRSRKAVEQLRANGKVARSFTSIGEAANAMNADVSEIKRACKYPQVVFKGFRWRYKNI